MPEEEQITLQQGIDDDGTTWLRIPIRDDYSIRILNPMPVDCELPFLRAMADPEDGIAAVDAVQALFDVGVHHDDRKPFEKWRKNARPQVGTQRMIDLLVTAMGVDELPLADTVPATASAPPSSHTGSASTTTQQSSPAIVSHTEPPAPSSDSGHSESGSQPHTHISPSTTSDASRLSDPPKIAPPSTLHSADALPDPPADDVPR